jgi:hypothetical protein
MKKSCMMIAKTKGALTRKRVQGGLFMADKKQPRDYTPHQQKIIKRYYDNQGAIKQQRLAELVGELYLAEGKKKARVWQAAAQAMAALGVPQSRIQHLVKQGDPALVAEVVKELEAGK